MQDLYKPRIKSKLLSYSFIFILLSCLVYALDECQATTVRQDDVPCLVLLQFTQPNLDCSDYSVSFYNESSFLYSQVMSNYSAYLCSANFTQTKVGTYNFNYSTGDVGSIVVTEGIILISLFFFGIVVTIILLVIGFWKEDIWFLNFGSFFLMTLGVYLLINGFNSETNLMTLALGSIAVGLGAYISFRANYEYWQQNDMAIS